MKLNQGDFICRSTSKPSLQGDSITPKWGQSWCFCRECMMPGISHHHHFLHLSFLLILLQGFLQLAGPLSAIQEQPGDNHNIAGAAVPARAVKTAGEDLIIYSTSLDSRHRGRIFWHGGARCGPYPVISLCSRGSSAERPTYSRNTNESHINRWYCW